MDKRNNFLHSKFALDESGNLWILEGEGEGGMIWENGIVTCILSYKNRITSLCPMQDTACFGLVNGMTQRDVVGREMGGGFMFGNTCTPVVDSCQCMAKPIQYCKVK